MLHPNQKINLRRGQAMIIAVVFFLAASLLIVLGVANIVLREFAMALTLERSKQSYYLAEAGMEDALYRLKKGMTTSASLSVPLETYSALVTIATLNSNDREITSVSAREGYTRKVKTFLTTGNGASFHYGIQTGDGGLRMENSSSVEGNVYSNGPVVGTQTNVVKGDVVSASDSGIIEGVHATSSAYAYTIKDSTVDKDAYYQVKINTTVAGTSYPGSAPQATSSLPIADSLIEEWKTEAEAGGVISSPCPYIINTDVTIGPKKINCDFEISGNPTVTLGGPLWVVGTITVNNTPTIRIDASLGNKGIALVADDPNNRTTSSKIDLKNANTFEGSGASNSYILMISNNNSAESGGAEIAIEAAQSVSGDLLLFAGHGLIELQNNVNLKEVSGYKLKLKNSAKVTYSSGIANLLFTAGPGGGYVIESWQEVE
ncbi:MAG: hypothetical protein Q7S15_01715 [bacterium]|nr:hypothetical protein [bacterium]